MFPTYTTFNSPIPNYPHGSRYTYISHKEKVTVVFQAIAPYECYYERTSHEFWADEFVCRNTEMAMIWGFIAAKDDERKDPVALVFPGH